MLSIVCSCCDSAIGLADIELSEALKKKKENANTIVDGLAVLFSDCLLTGDFFHLNQ